jgi:hypothetical protein
VERARYEAERAERQYRAVEPENRLVAGGLETEWEKRLRDLAAAEAELERRERQRPRALSEEEKKKILSLSVPICTKSGPRLPPRIAIAKSFCVLFWKR